MVDEISRQLPVVQNSVSPPFWGRALLNAVSEVGEGELVLRFSNGAERTIRAAKSGASAVLNIARARTLRRLVFGGTVGLAESYLDGDWESPDLASVFEFGARNMDRMIGGLRGMSLLRLPRILKHKARANTRRGAKRNIAAHYDLGNTFYSQWLDPTMTYSSALFETKDMSLEDAQRAKWQRLAETLDLKPGHRVLEIGCGWGGFAEVAAREGGHRVTGLTLSIEQLGYARSRLDQAGLSKHADLRLQDYRELEGSFDGVASIEMFEAVGEAYWPDYFSSVARALKPGGRACIQTITIADDLFARYRNGTDFIQQYIFPGGMLPCPRAFREQAARHGLRLVNELAFGQDYARTLQQWRMAFKAQLARVHEQGFDDRFVRTWEFYLAYCEAGFRAGSLDVYQFTLEKV